MHTDPTPDGPTKPHSAWRRAGAVAVFAAFACLGCVGAAHVPATPRPNAAVRAPPDRPAVCAACTGSQGEGAEDLCRRLAPSVVVVTTVQSVEPSFLDDPLGFLLEPDAPRERVWERGQATGFVVEPPGLVVTAAHVVRGAKVIRIQTADGTELAARLVGADPLLDVALLEVDTATPLPAVTLGSSDPLRVGERVLAIGNPYGLGHTATLGIVSAKGRAIGLGPYDDLVQTDAAINPGHSGGPLFDMRGRVVAVNAAIHPEAIGIAFAIPIDALKDVLAELRATGRVRRAALGVGVQTVTARLAASLGLERPRGALVIDLAPDGAAAKAGLRPADVVLEIDGEEVADADELPRRIARLQPGATVALTIVRNKVARRVLARLDELAALDEAATPSPPRASAKSPAGRALGIEITEGPDGGVYVADLLDPAKAGELEPGDLLLALDGKQIRDVADLTARLRHAAPGTRLLFRVRRERGVRFAAAEVAPD